MKSRRLADMLVSKGAAEYEQLKDMFASPPVEHRSIPFWSWNGKLEQAELNTQIEGFKAQGMGGFMMHVREGLETAYLSDEFMERIKESVEKAKAEGIYAWLYDEDRYSSGMGGGLVARAGGDAVRAKALELVICQEFLADDSILAVYRAEVNGNELVSCVKLEDARAGRPPLGGNEVYLVMHRRIAARNEWCNGETHTDVMNPESARLFIETTYERYKQAVGEEFGRTVPGIFTDEPFIRGFKERLHAPDMTWIAWSDLLPAAFAARRGYEIWDTLPYFFFHGPPAAKIRHDYWRTVTEMFCSAYTEQIGDWCRENGILFTGHYCEIGIVGAVQFGGAVMPHYRYLDIPGIDILCEQTDESLTVKQASSVARQYGKKKVLSETYGVTGWDLTFEGRKWIGDWQFALGVNLLTHHLALYSLRGCRKRDYPPSFNYNVNWWEHNHTIEDYFARLGALLSEGDAVREVLVVHPGTSVWARLGMDVQAAQWRNKAGNTEELDRYNREFHELVQLLLGEHYDFDLGDELIMQEIGRVEGSRLQVGQADYRVVVLPSLSNMLRPTFELLVAYVNAGGIVLSYGNVPHLLEGVPSTELELLTNHPAFRRLASRYELVMELEKRLPRSVSLKDRSGREADRLLYMRRELADCTVVFVVNNDRDNAVDVEVRIQGCGKLEEWNVLTGDRFAREVEAAGGYSVFRDSFGAADSKLYVLTPGEEDAPSPLPETGDLQPATGLGPVAGFTRTAPNALVLDRCRYRIGEEAWSEPMGVWQAQRQLRERLDMKQVYMNGNLQRYLWIHEPHPHDGTPVAFCFVFEVKDIPETDTFLVFEQAERFRCRLNGRMLEEALDGWYLDRSMGKLKLSELQTGENVLEVLCDYRHDMEIEDAFLIGDFAVDGSRRLVKEPDRLRFGDWCLQGYPHYCGSMIYHFELDVEVKGGRKIVMELGSYEAVTLQLTINGRDKKAIPWRSAGKVELTDSLVPGVNRIDIEVAGSPRNLFGPLHEARSNHTWQDWWSFRPEGAEYTDDYVLRPYGLMGQIHIYG
ncbi:hypothetical protein SAMN02799630_03404 [Paenibacillus sp. UNCCL117]|uniref:glycosyl hydrolase n=1 Tax=unclassified Paenibacillus TaxID=185978 RepID=UPI00087E900A|nr:MULTISPECIES: glycosyl hydrolase [unclassified Paenibacillus]SDE44992.1 hypothetical protein SAMN04488602_12878 [Paenibacillus sp. cl123]SFW46410.1 hypothetical protein SAMN02799630_03404 [Paenibacillus sp. UNCCL117]